MKYDVLLPQTEFGEHPRAIKDYAQTAEELGNDVLLVLDRVLGAHSNREPELGGTVQLRRPVSRVSAAPRVSPAVTKRRELVTGILILPQRQTTLVANRAAEVDVLNLSGGRGRLGIGFGWNYLEHGALRKDFHPAF